MFLRFTDGGKSLGWNSSNMCILCVTHLYKMPQTTQKYRVLFPKTTFNVPNTLGAVWKGACGEGFWKQISQRVLGWASGVSSGVTPLSTISCSLSSFGRVKTQWRFSMGRKAYCLCTKLMVVLLVMPLSSSQMMRMLTKPSTSTGSA